MILDRRPIIVDLSVPAAVPDALADGLGDRLVTADDVAHGDGNADMGPGSRTPAPTASSSDRMVRELFSL